MSKVKRALILAAGRGSRLGEHTRDVPKPLQPLGSGTLVERQFRQMSSRGIELVRLVVGYLAEDVRSALGDQFEGMKIEYTENEVWSESGSGWSLMLASGDLESGEDLLVTHGDVVYDDEILDACMAPQDASVIAIDLSWKRVTGDEVLGWDRDGQARGVIKGEVPETHDRAGEFIGVSRFQAGFAQEFAAHCRNRLVETKRLDYEQPLLSEFIQASPLRCVLSGTQGVDWINVNYAEDLTFAQQRFGE